MNNMRFFFRMILVAVILFIIVQSSACSSAVSDPFATSTPSPIPPSPTETAPPEPTSTPIPSPTLPLTARDFYGIWMVFDVEAAGQNYLNFREDGTFLASHGPIYPGILLHEGHYELNGNEIKFLDWWYCEPDQRTATYLIRMGTANGKNYIRFFPVDDPCEERVYDFTNRIIKWGWFVLTATPNP
ncbi:MAG: hypothetical protein JNK32_09440 [Anaerolineales bacterium]|nr:hypothetical protein [Anaerolineales bacterium]